MGACSAQRCSHLLQAAPYAPLDLRRRTLMGGHGFVNAFLEIKGSPVPYSGRSRSRLAASALRARQHRCPILGAGWERRGSVRRRQTRLA